MLVSNRKIMAYLARHTSALKCTVPAYIARCIDALMTVYSANPGNDLTLMGNFASMAIDGGPGPVRKPLPGRAAAAERGVVRGSPW